MSESDRKEVVRRFYEVMCNQRDLKIVTELFSSDLVFYEPASVRGDEGTGPAEWANEMIKLQNCGTCGMSSGSCSKLA